MAQVPRPAATLILLRPGGDGVEVLMIQRAKSAAFLGGAYVFPGGALDAADSDLKRRILGSLPPQPPAEYYIAAVRECFEEAGVALLCGGNGAQISSARAALLMNRRQQPFLEILEKEDLYIPAGELVYYANWITAPGRSRRFDARFFVAVAPEGQEGSHDAAETVHHLWISPREALARGERGEIELVFATQHTLRDLMTFRDPETALEQARLRPPVETNRACWAQGKEGAKLFRRADPQYFEIHWSDPEETGQSSYDLAPGLPKRLDRLVTRLIAPNPGMMTGPGCTHTHVDHSPAAAALKAATGAQLLGRPAPAGQDATFAPDRVMSHNERFIFDGVTLRALQTPGHASNHVCYLLEQTRMLFTGDHVMQGSTVVINPPDGDMRAYLDSLEMLLAEDLAILAPGHGYLIGEPQREIRRLISHRLARERKVLASLQQLGKASVEELLPLAYDDVPLRIHRVAARSLTAHLDKLVADGAVRADGPHYTLVKSAAAG